MADDLIAHDSVSSESLLDFLDRELAAQESQAPAVDVVVEEILQRAYVASNGWCSVEVTDNLGREYTLSTPTIEALADAVQKFLR